MRKDSILVLSQVYVPDPAAVGQYIADAAEALAARGHTVRVMTSGRGYDDPSQKYPLRERRNGVDVIRLPFASFGKKSIAVRLMGAAIFLSQTIVRCLFARRISCILVSTSPPMCSVAAMILGALRRVPIKYWVMDLNPDQMILLGRISQYSFAARLFDRLNRMILARSQDVIVLDRFMAERICRKLDIAEKLSVVPPWPLEDRLEPIAKSENPFVARYGLEGKRVIMYSGNHSIASPLATLLEAALRLRDDRRLVFLFIGGGLGKKEVDDLIHKERPPNVISLPYQPLSEIKYSLSAADVHVVSLGDTMVGVIHPCKVYGAMAVARPILVFGPRPSALAELVDGCSIGWHIPHGDVEGAVRCLREIAAMPRERLEAMGRVARRSVDAEWNKTRLCDQFCAIIERGIGRRAAADSRGVGRAPTLPAIDGQPAGSFAIEARRSLSADARQAGRPARQPTSRFAPSRLAGKRILVLGGPRLLSRAIRRELRSFEPAAVAVLPRPRRRAADRPDDTPDLITDFQPQVVIDLAALDGALSEPLACRAQHEAAWNALLHSNGPACPVMESLVSLNDSRRLSSRATGLEQYGVRTVPIWTASFYGPRDDFDRQNPRVVPAWIRQVIDAREAGARHIEVSCSPSGKNPYLLVRDVGRAIAMAADRYEKSQPLFVGSREVVTDDQLMELICDLCAYPGEVRWREQTAVTHVVCADPRLFAQDEIGFGATTSLREGLIETIAWYERNRSRLQKSPHHDRTEHSAPQRTTA